MESSTLYLKWRPQSLSEVVGQEHITHTLRNALRSGRISHAYLLTGPRGTGKTSTGRILAKAVNCLDNQGKDEPCNKCSMCQAITEGRAMDVIEIDAASNRGIDDIRDLREKAGFAPNVARRKVYIIDEVHMLTTPASNALLKTLEEPPPHVLFILATTESHQLLPTIISRCQRYDFHRLSMAAVVKRLVQICQKEGFTIEEEVLKLIAKSATGSLRDAENILEQLISTYGDIVTLDQARLVLNATSESQVRELAGYVINSDIQGGVNAINRIAQEGTDLAQLHRGLMDYIRNLLFTRIGADQSIEATREEKQEMKKLAGSVSPEFLFKALRAFGEKDQKMDSYSTLPLELALLEACLTSGDRGRESVVRKLESGVRAVTASARAHTETAAKPDKTQDLKLMTSDSAHPPEADAPRPGESPAHRTGGAPPATELGDIQGRWREFVNSLRGLGSGGALDAYL
ncbi:MAG: DNA polymerase III subunit gamma/tau, partial [Dehalococcoidia bacterium]|nr:DNA polymerase III subunit gamma/tau [Dehalococcoidia bacterium]